MFAGIGEAPVLLCIIFRRPIQLPPFFTDLVRNIQKNEYVGIGDTPPHIGNVRMLLGDMPRVQAGFFEIFGEGGFSGCTRPNDANQQVVRKILQLEIMI